LIQESFPKRTYQITLPIGIPGNASYAKLDGTIDRHLTELTLCQWLRFTPYNDKWGCSFCYFSDGRKLNTFFITNKLHFYRKNVADVPLMYPSNQWFHLCTTWSQRNGEHSVALNGKAVLSKSGLDVDTVVEPFGQVTLGEEQIPVDGRLEHHNSFFGHISEVYLWDHVLTIEDIEKVYNCDYEEEANVISWNLATWSLYKNAKVSFVDIPCGRQKK